MKNNITETKETNRKWQRRVKRVLAAVRRKYDVHNRNFEMSDFYRICKGEGVHILREKMRPLGQYTHYKDVVWIVFRENLNNDYIFEQVAFHELGHHFLHRNDLLKHYFVDDHSEATKLAEQEADLFCYLALGNKLIRSLPCKTFSLDVTDDSLKELEINKGDEIIVDTYEAVGNGNLILISNGENYACGIARFIGDGKVELHYGFEDGHKFDTFELSEIKIIGRVISTRRNWKHFRLSEVKTDER